MDLGGLDAATLGEGRLDDPPDREVGDRVEVGVAHDHVGVDDVEASGGLFPMAVDERRLGIEALAVGGGQELEVEAGALTVGRERELSSHLPVALQEGHPQAGAAADHPSAVSRQRHLSDLLRLPERLASPDHRLLGRHRHDERVVPDCPFVLAGDRERRRPERRPAGNVDAGDRHARERLVARFERRRQHGGDYVRIGFVEHGQGRRPGADRGRLELPVAQLGLGTGAVADLGHDAAPSAHATRRARRAPHPPAKAGHRVASLGISSRGRDLATSATVGPTSAATGARVSRSKP